MGANAGAGLARVRGVWVDVGVAMNSTAMVGAAGTFYRGAVTDLRRAFDLVVMVIGGGGGGGSDGVVIIIIVVGEMVVVVCMEMMMVVMKT